MRRGEILNLKWSQIRNGFVYLEKTKTKTGREISVKDEFARVLKEIGKEQGLTSEYVLTYARQAVGKVGVPPVTRGGEFLVEAFMSSTRGGGLSHN